MELGGKYQLISFHQFFLTSLKKMSKFVGSIFIPDSLIGYCDSQMHHTPNHKQINRESPPIRDGFVLTGERQRGACNQDGK